MSKHRRLIVLLASAIAAGGMAFAVQAAVPAYACACGAFAPPEGLHGSLDMSSEASILSLQGGQETIEMRLGIDSLTTETGLIFPTPAPAKVSQGAVSDFESVGTEMTPEILTGNDWWTGWLRFGFGTAGGAAPSGGAPTVIDQVQLGPVQATTLAATDAAGLTAWLDENGYGLRPAVSALLSRYVDMGWYFVALKLTGAEPIYGELDPLTFSFASDRYVYPMALSQAATTPQKVYLYVFADHKQDVSFLDGTGTYNTVLWARAVRDPELQKRGAYLTAFYLDYYAPQSQIKDDLLLSQAANDDEVGTVIDHKNYVSFFGIPMGWILLTIGLVTGLLIWRRINLRKKSTFVPPVYR